MDEEDKCWPVLAEPRYAISSRHLGMSATSSNSVPVFVAAVLGLVIMVDKTVAAVVVGLIAADEDEDEDDEEELVDEASKYRSTSVLSSFSPPPPPFSSGVNLSKAAEWALLGSTVRT